MGLDAVRDVIFRRWKDRPAPAGVIAIFPQERLPAGHYGCVASEHLDQHGTIDYRYNLRRTVRATPREYRELKDYLERRGYRLRVLARMPTRRPPGRNRPCSASRGSRRTGGSSSGPKPNISSAGVR
jgi:hypothetical protein